MVKILVITGMLALAACKAGPPRDCKVVKSEAAKCLKRHSAGTGRELLLGCFPFSPPERIEGAWVSGFETNEFYEGQQATTSLINHGVGGTELEIRVTATPGPFPEMYQTAFIGRRSRCDMGLPHHIIIVEKVLSMTRTAGP